MRENLSGGEALSAIVEVSRRQATDPGYVDVVAGALAVTGLPASALRLVISAQLPAERLRIARWVMTHVRDLGVRLVIDDLGYDADASGRLAMFPVSTIRVHRTLLDRSGHVDAGPSAIVELAHRSGLDVLATGVSSPGQHSRLAALGCDFVSGDYYAPAVPGYELREALTARHSPRG